MIDISSQQQLKLLFPHSNKALEKILEKATPEQLKIFSEAKDIKDIVKQLMNDTIDVNKSNKIILDILKNSDFFKDLGNFPKELKSLVELLTKVEKNPTQDAKIEKILLLLKSSLLDAPNSDATKLKSFVKDSGVFLESKLAQEKSPTIELKSSLDLLKNIINKSDIKDTKNIIKDIEKILTKSQNINLEKEPETLKVIQKDITKIVNRLKDIIKLADPIYSKDVKNLIVKLENITQNMTNKQENITNIKSTINDLISEMRVSPKEGTKTLVKALSVIENKINDIIKQNNTPTLIKSLTKELNLHVEKAQSNLDIKTPNLHVEKPQVSLDIKELKLHVEKTEKLARLSFTDLQDIKHADLKTFFTSITAITSTLPANTSKGILDLIEKILSSLRQPSESMVEKKVPTDIKNFLNNFTKEINKGDILFSKETLKTIDKLSVFIKEPKLMNKSLIQQDIHKDMKALLLGLEKEISASTITNTNDILKSVDKLLVQIDYFQLLSHLSNSSALYLPYTWDQLEDGQFSIKKSKDGSYFCEIDLELKEYGKLNMMLQLFEKNQLNIMIYTQKDSLKDVFKDNMKDLRAMLTSVNIHPRNIKLHKLNEDTKASPYGNIEKLHELGFEVKG